jgi:hypothetical protein
MFSVPEVMVSGVVAGVLAGGVLRATTWARQRRRFLVAGVATSVGFIAWNVVLVGANANGINVDIPFTPLSFQDLGSGVVAFAAAVAALGLLLEPNEPARRVVGAAGIAGLVATVFDIFVL